MDSWPGIWNNMEQCCFTLRHSAVIVSLPLYRHPVWCPSGLEICTSGSAEQAGHFARLCFLTCAHLFLLCILSWWAMETSAIALGFSHICRGESQSSFGPAPRMNGVARRRDVHTGLPSACCLLLCSTQPWCPLEPRRTQSSSGANWEGADAAVSGRRVTGICKAPSTGNLALQGRKSRFQLLFPALAWPESRNRRAPGLCSHAGMTARWQIFLFLRPVGWIYCFASVKQLGTEVLIISSSIYSSGDMTKIGCSYRLKRQWVENCWKLLV